MGTVELTKLLSLLAAGSFGALGIATKSVDERHKLTRWGWAALGGVLLSTALSVTIFQMESKADAKRLEENLNRQQKMLNALDTTVLQQQQTVALASRNLIKSEEVSSRLATGVQRISNVEAGMSRSLVQQHLISRSTARLLRPLKIEGAEFAIEYSMSDPRFQRYVARVEKTLKSQGLNPPPLPAGSHAEGPFMDISRSPDLLPIFEGSSGEYEAALLLSHASLFIYFDEKVSANDWNPDLRFQAAAEPQQRVLFGPNEAPSRSTVRITFNFGRRTIEQRALVIDVAKEKDRGKFGSFIDLTGATMRIKLPVGNGEGPMGKLTRIVLYEDTQFSKRYEIPVKVFTPIDRDTLAHKVTDKDFGS